MRVWKLFTESVCAVVLSKWFQLVHRRSHKELAFVLLRVTVLYVEAYIVVLVLVLPVKRPQSSI